MSTPKKPLKEAFGKIARTLARLGLPALGTAIGGPAGGVIAGTLGSLLGTDPRDPDALDEALAKASPEVIAKIRELEANVDLRELESLDHDASQVTARWQADASSSYWLPNNIRPLALASAILFWIVWNLISAAVVTVCFWRVQSVPDALTGFFVSIGLQISGVVVPMVLAYFGARSYDKRREKMFS